MTNLPPLTKQQVCDSQWNHSSSKMLYSFPKAIRFSPFKKSDRPDFYPLPSVRSTRAAGMGYGGRSDFTTGSKLDKPAFYPVKRDFDVGTELGPAYSFSASREAYSKVYIETNVHPDADNPGPGNYNLIKNNDGPAFSMGVRCETDIDSRRNYPGPGTYKDPLSINTEGHYPLSTKINTKPVDFSMYKEKRFNYRYNNVPGPIYKIKPLFGGPIFNSKFKSSVSMSFGSRYNIHKSDNTPGPGAYRVYSEFGDLPKIKRRKFKFRKKEEEKKDDEKKEEGKEEVFMEKEEKNDVKPKNEVENAGNVEENKQEEKKDDEKKEEIPQENKDEKVEQGQEDGAINKTEVNKEGENKEEEVKQDENKVEENKEGEVKQDENKVEENKEGEVKQDENKVEENKEGENNENKVEENGDDGIDKIKENKEGENNENKVEENKEGEVKQDENKVEENKEGENNENKVEENKEGENNENKVEENKVEENKEGDNNENKKDENQNKGEEIVGGFMENEEKDKAKDDK